MLVKKLDRLGRTLLVIVDAHDRRREAAQVAQRSTTEPINTATASGRLTFQLVARVAEYDRESIWERTQARRHKAFRSGKQSGSIPYDNSKLLMNSFETDLA